MFRLSRECKGSAGSAFCFCFLPWFGLVGFGLVWSGLVWFGLVWFGLVWFGLVWFGLVWFGLIWFDQAWFSLIRLGLVSFWFNLVGLFCDGSKTWETKGNGGARSRKVLKEFDPLGGRDPSCSSQFGFSFGFG